MAYDGAVFKEKPLPRVAEECRTAQEAYCLAWFDDKCAEVLGHAGMVLLDYAACFEGSSVDLGPWRWEHAARVAGLFDQRRLTEARQWLVLLFPALVWDEREPGWLVRPDGLAERAFLAVNPRSRETDGELERARACFGSHGEAEA